MRLIAWLPLDGMLTGPGRRKQPEVPSGLDILDTPVGNYAVTFTGDLRGVEQGLAAVFARPGDRTPQRVGLGSSLDDVRGAYPAARKGANAYWTVPVKGAGVPAEYQFGIEADGTVGEMVWTRTDQQCFG